MRENMLSLARFDDMGGSRPKKDMTRNAEKNDTTFRCGVLKDHSYVSFSPAMHTAGYGSVGVQGYEYKEYSVEKPDFKKQMAEFLDPSNNFRLISVGKPYKEDVMAKDDAGNFIYLNGGIDQAAELIGAVNTIIIDKSPNGDEIFASGTNTDYIGFVEAVKEKGGKLDGVVMVSGSGGAARASIFGALQEGAKEIIVVARDTKDEEKKKVLEKLVSDFEKQGANISILDLAQLTVEDMAEADVIVSATGSSMVLPAEGILEDHAVVEWAYDKGIKETELEREAKLRAKMVADGRSILVHQAIGQFERATGHNAPLEVFREEVKKGTL
ncbi:MAG: hypothetical protein KA035_00695 [Candidatus Levybacteria bacterium]|nr:hypothetical protein [Candidatus Levybacteria bacterium]